MSRWASPLLGIGNIALYVVRSEIYVLVLRFLVKLRFPNDVNELLSNSLEEGKINLSGSTSS